MAKETYTALWLLAFFLIDDVHKPRADTVWSNVRDGIIYIRAKEKTSIEYLWKPAWAADGHSERYL